MLDILSANTTYTLLGTLSLVSLTCLMFYPSSALRWMSKKRYQYEVTFSLYMMTPTEKFIFNSILFLFLSMVTIACTLYLPEHIAMILRRAYYYALGDTEHLPHALSAAVEVATSTAASAASELSSAATGVSETAAAITVTGAQQTVTETVVRAAEKATSEVVSSMAASASRALGGDL